MTEKEKLARKSLQALFLEVDASIASNHQQIVLDALNEAKNISSNPPVMKSLPPVTDSDIDAEAIRRWDLTSKYDFGAGAKWMREKLSGGNVS